VPILIRELQNYQVKVTPAANEVFNAREGEHDDLLLALALAAWNGERTPPFDPPMVISSRPRNPGWANPECPFRRRDRGDFLRRRRA
jgi:hypothetical protein